MTETPPCRDTGQWLSSQKTASATRSKTSRLTQVEDGSRFAALEPVSQAVIARFGGIEADAARGTSAILSLTRLRAHGAAEWARTATGRTDAGSS